MTIYIKRFTSHRVELDEQADKPTHVNNTAENNTTFSTLSTRVLASLYFRAKKDDDDDDDKLSHKSPVQYDTIRYDKMVCI